jgi:two-component system, OmpR family, sensor histidine kinase KdpD
MDSSRPDPDALLAQITREEKRKKRGNLKIFLGYAAGVGKTYEMLKAAHERLREGVDVRIGYVETHGRVETEELVSGLPVIPRRVVQYKSTTISELDLDAVLNQHPSLVLIDELAHTNPDGFRHLKRYQDVEEVLQAGIDVYTTLNIQHLESVHDVVAQITTIVVRETVPDRIIDEADEIELMDLPPPELRQRLAEGKVYVPDMASRAIENFFNEGNLFALRELSLRKTADRVDTQMLEYMQNRSIPGPWPTNEHILVSIGPSPLSEKLVRTTKRQADRMNADWRAIYIETPMQHRMPRESREQVHKTIKLAESLGGRTETLFGLTIVDTLIDYAKKHNITRIIIGKTLRPRWKEIVFGSIVDQMIHKSGDIDVYVISTRDGGFHRNAPFQHFFQTFQIPKNYLEVLALIGVITLFGELTKGIISQTNLMMLYLMLVVFAAFRQGLALAICTAFLGVLVFDFFFVVPYYTFRVSDTQYFISFAVMLLVGIVISILISRSQDYAISAHSREWENAMLYNIAKELTGSTSISSICTVIISKIEENFSWKVVIFLAEDNSLKVAHSSQSLMVNDDDKAVAMWAFSRNAVAGYDTDTLHAARFRFIPIRSVKGVIGVLGVMPEDPDGLISPDQGRVLEIFADLMGLAMERFQDLESEVSDTAT